MEPLRVPRDKEQDSAFKQGLNLLGENSLPWKRGWDLPAGAHSGNASVSMTFLLGRCHLLTHYTPLQSTRLSKPILSLPALVSMSQGGL